jgi:hypothetical protein
MPTYPLVDSSESRFNGVDETRSEHSVRAEDLSTVGHTTGTEASQAPGGCSDVVAVVDEGGLKHRLFHPVRCGQACHSLFDPWTTNAFGVDPDWCVSVPDGILADTVAAAEEIEQYEERALSTIEHLGFIKRLAVDGLHDIGPSVPLAWHDDAAGKPWLAAALVEPRYNAREGVLSPHGSRLVNERPFVGECQPVDRPSIVVGISKRPADCREFGVRLNRKSIDQLCPIMLKSTNQFNEGTLPLQCPMIDNLFGRSQIERGLPLTYLSMYVVREYCRFNLVIAEAAALRLKPSDE